MYLFIHKMCFFLRCFKGNLIRFYSQTDFPGCASPGSGWGNICQPNLSFWVRLPQSLWAPLLITDQCNLLVFGLWVECGGEACSEEHGGFKSMKDPAIWSCVCNQLSLLCCPAIFVLCNNYDLYCWATHFDMPGDSIYTSWCLLHFDTFQRRTWAFIIGVYQSISWIFFK